MKLFFVRHGETDYNRQGIIQGARDIPLNDAGRAQAKVLREKIVELSLEAIFSSPLKRAKETAEILNENLSLPVHFDDRLVERHFGELEGKSYESLDWSKDEDNWDFLKDAYESFGVESIESMDKRIDSFIEDLKKTPFERVLILSHGSLGKLFMKKIQKKSGENKEQVIQNCAIVELEL
ncbi:histidine phosphatase family protein [Guggenheimella bovis]